MNDQTRKKRKRRNNMKTYYGLSSLRDVYCPKCGNYLEVVLNGWFHGELFYCPKEKIIFNIVLEDITKQTSEEYLDQCNFHVRKNIILPKITRENIEQIEKIIK
jgi:hypothetical protein